MDEKQIIEAHFSGCDGLGLGRFLELGAHDGVRNSLTAGLVDAGWSGVQVEPDPLAFLQLRANREGNPRIALVNAAVARVAGLQPFWSQSDGGEESTLDAGHREMSGKPYHRQRGVGCRLACGVRRTARVGFFAHRRGGDQQ
jgi:FkbM family methyltransferase